MKTGDVITINEKSHSCIKIKSVLESNGSRPVPKWLEVSNEKLEAKMVAMPSREDIDLDVEETLIVELYSK